MAKIYLNNIPNSPIKSVIIDDDKGIALYGKSGKELTLKNKVYIDNFFNFIGKKHHILQVVTPEINEAIQNWSTQYINRLKYKGLEEYNRMGEIIEQKLREAREEDKNLLVVLGEEHECRDPQFFQLLLVDICLTKGIKNLLLEESSVEAYSPTITYYAYNHLFWNVISNSMLQQNISLHPIDPLHEQYGERKVSPLSRDKAILKSILEVGKDAIVVVGGAHMVDFMKNDELKKYKLAIFHSANRAYSKEYKNKSPQQLEKSLKNLESVVSAAEHKIQEELNSLQ